MEEEVPGPVDTNKNLRTRALSGLLWQASARGSVQILTWASTFLVIRILTPEDYGTMGLIGIYSAYVETGFELGLTSALVRFPTTSAAVLRAIFWLTLGLSLVFVAGTMALAPFIATFFSNPVAEPAFRLAAFGLPLVAAGVLPMSRLSRELRFRDLSLIEIQSSLAGSIASLVLALTGFGVWSLIWGWLLGRATRLVAAWARSPVSLRGPSSLRGSTDLLRFGAWSAIDRLLFTAYNTADSVIIGRLVGPVPLGIYTTSLNLSRMALRKLAPLFNSVGFPVLSSVADERERFVRYELGLSRAISLIGIPVFVGIAVTAADIVPLLLTDKWIETVLPIQVLAPIAGVQLLSTRLANAISAKGRPAWNARLTGAMVILLPCSFWVMVSRGYGIPGILSVLALAYPLLLMIRLIMLRRLTGMRLGAYGSALAPALVSSLAMAAAVLGIRVSLVDADMAPRLAICVVAGASLYAVLLFALFRPVIDDALQRLRELRS